MRNHFHAILVLFLFGTPQTYGFQQQRQITGIITDGINPLQGAHIQIEGTTDISIADSTGRYAISVRTGDLLKFSHTGFKPSTILIEDVTERLNIILRPAITELDAVTVTGSKRRKTRNLAKEYFSNKEIVKYSFGYLDKNAAGGTMRVLDKSQISNVNLCIMDILRGKFAGIFVQGDCSNGGSVVIRGSGSINSGGSALFDVDGQLFTDPPIWINVNNIERIAVLSSLGMTNIYGQLGNNGVVIINTVAATGSPTSGIQGNTGIFNSETYKGDALEESKLLSDLATYYRRTAKAQSEKEAIEAYQDQFSVYGKEPYFLLNSYRAFSKYWPESNYSDEILATANKVFEGNPVLLKAAAFSLEADGDLDGARTRYTEILKLRPQHPQSYLDLARVLSLNNQKEKSSEILIRFASLLHSGKLVIDNAPIREYVDRELLAIQASNNRIILGKELLDRILEQNGPKLGSKRIVIEWNNSDAEFIVEFVNPNGQAFHWEHTLDSDPGFIRNEKLNGVSSRDFFLDSEPQGKWLMNIRYLGNKSETPTYFKSTLYHNYGLDSQKSESSFLVTQLKSINHAFLQLVN